MVSRILGFMLVMCVVMLSVNGFAKGVLSGAVNINTATAEEIAKLPGIGLKKAELIVEYRKTKKFQTINDLLDVKGISQKIADKIKPYVKFEGETDLTVEKKTVSKMPDKNREA